MAAGKRMTLAFKKNVCGRCNLAGKKALKQGKAHCGFKGTPRISDGQCREAAK